MDNSQKTLVLVVDDNPAGLYATSKTLQHEGFSIIAATTGREAIEKARQKPDVILLDVKLPDISGFEVCKHIKSDPLLSHIPVIHVSATFLDNDYKVKGLDTGADAYLTQPVEPKVLTATIKAMLRVRQAEAKIRAAGLKWQTTFDAITDGICLLEKTGLISQYNKAFKIISGNSDESKTGMQLSSVLAELKRFDQDFFSGLASENISHFNREEIKINKTWYLVSFDAVVDEQGEFTSLIFKMTDITKIKQAEEKVQKTLEELERSNKELQQFAYVASHDLQEPLRMVTSYTQMLEKRYKGQLDSNADKFINFAVDGSKRMQNLIHDLLEYSRVTSKGKQFVPVNLQEVMDTVRNNLEISINENNAVINYETLPEVTADPLQMVQLFQNLVSNAIKFRGPENPEIKISVNNVSGEWRFCIKDNGIGIDPQFKERIFEIFQQLHTKEEYSGTGIGLSICKKIVERHRGKIWVESEKGHGATFCFTIPC